MANQISKIDVPNSPKQRIDSPKVVRILTQTNNNNIKNNSMTASPTIIQLENNSHANQNSYTYHNHNQNLVNTKETMSPQATPKLNKTCKHILY
jgi:hypothetical protein